jgi:hypothetical protein
MLERLHNKIDVRSKWFARGVAITAGAITLSGAGYCIDNIADAQLDFKKIPATTAQQYVEFTILEDKAAGMKISGDEKGAKVIINTPEYMNGLIAQKEINDTNKLNDQLLITTNEQNQPYAVGLIASFVLFTGTLLGYSAASQYREHKERAVKFAERSKKISEMEKQVDRFIEQRNRQPSTEEKPEDFDIPSPS